MMEPAKFWGRKFANVKYGMELYLASHCQEVTVVVYLANPDYFEKHCTFQITE